MMKPEFYEQHSWSNVESAVKIFSSLCEEHGQAANLIAQQSEEIRALQSQIQELDIPGGLSEDRIAKKMETLQRAMSKVLEGDEPSLQPTSLIEQFLSDFRASQTKLLQQVERRKALLETVNVELQIVRELGEHIRSEAEQAQAAANGSADAQKDASDVDNDDVDLSSLFSVPDLRAHERHEVRAKVDFSSENNFYVGFSGDISEGGIFLETVDIMEVGTEVELNIDLPSGDQVKCKGVVRWIREPGGYDYDNQEHPGMGIQFSTIQDPVILADFVQRREPIFLPS